MKQKEEFCKSMVAYCLSISPLYHRKPQLSPDFSVLYILAQYPTESRSSVFSDFNLIVALFYLLTLFHFQLDLLKAVNVMSMFMDS